MVKCLAALLCAAPALADVYHWSDLGAGKCARADGSGPTYTYHGGLSKNECQSMCDEDDTCGGYAESASNNCLLFLESDLTLSTEQWGGCHCIVKKDGVATTTTLAPPSPSPPADDHWAVIVAGSKGYGNYRHQADACHAYQIVKSKGVPEDHIILMAYDDVAGSSSNPFPGQLFNKPTPSGTPGVDVYAGCKIDYKGADVTPDNFLNVLTGKGSGKVLKSTSSDNVFVYFADHGAPGLVAFPSEELHKQQLQTAFQDMKSAGMFKNLVFYLEACESGSMFEGMSIDGVYALSASNPTESSWGTYCGAAAMVNGKAINSCLGDLFSVSWMEDSDASDTTTETLDDQFRTVKSLTDKSEVMHWGDVSFRSDFVSEYIGSLALDRSLTSGAGSASSAVSARKVDLDRHFNMYSAAASSFDRLAAGEALMAELNSQMAVEATYLQFASLVHPKNEVKREALWTRRSKPDLADCELEVHRAIRESCADKFDANSGFALQFHQVVVNACADVAEEGLNADLALMARQACGAEGRLV